MRLIHNYGMFAFGFINPLQQVLAKLQLNLAVIRVFNQVADLIRVFFEVVQEIVRIEVAVGLCTAVYSGRVDGVGVIFGAQTAPHTALGDL